MANVMQLLSNALTMVNISPNNKKFQIKSASAKLQYI